MTFTGKFKYQTNENYEEYLRLLGLSWFRRKKSIFLCPKVIVSQGSEPGSLVICGGEIDETANEKRLIVLGEEHLEVLPNGEQVKAVTVQEGDNCLLTRLKNNMEIKKEFNSQGMTQYIRQIDSDLEITRYFKRC